MYLSLLHNLRLYLKVVCMHGLCSDLQSSFFLGQVKGQGNFLKNPCPYNNFIFLSLAILLIRLYLNTVWKGCTMTSNKFSKGKSQSKFFKYCS